jgi:DNA invertase Pin-like site-specific DNA recombinase
MTPNCVSPRILRPALAGSSDNHNHYGYSQRRKRRSRQGLDELMRLVRRGKVDVIACYKLDRLGRSLPHLAQLIAELDCHHVALIATSQAIDTSEDSPAGRLQMHVLAAVAQFERTLIVERVRAGQAAARSNGVKFGRPATLHLRETEIGNLLRNGLSCRRIAAETGLPLGSVFRISRKLKRTISSAGAPG